MFTYILTSNEEGVFQIRLNRSEVLHALNTEMLSELKKAFEIAQEDAFVRVILLTAEGDKAFCSGADLKATLASGQTTEFLLRTYFNPLIQLIREIPKPVICYLNGLAAGAGASLALSCDVIIAREQAYLSQIFIQIGLMPDAGATFFLPRLVGLARAFELATTGRKVYAQEASEIGLIQKCVSDSEIQSVLSSTIHYYKHAPTRAIGLIKQAFNRSQQASLSEMLEFEAIHQEILARSTDAQIGVQSFLEKKVPVYQGR
jgi:2-(1,2-epoxy-1,2-dihydrophenyl)acetyl-CoA isomerase